MRVAIVGAGAIGAWVGARLARAGHEVGMLARGAALEAIAARGLILREDGAESEAPVTVADEAAALGERELVVIAVKAPALADAAEAARPLIGRGTTIVPMLNGVPWWFLGGRRLASVDPDGRTGEALRLDRILGCVVHAACTSPQPGVAERVSGNGLILGEPGGGMTARLDEIADIFAAAGFAVTRSEHVQKDVWYKLWGNMTMNPLSAIVGATADRILDDPLVEAFILAVMAEAAEIGARIGCPIAESGRDRIAVTRRLGAFRTSMLQDAEAGRPLELDALLAAPREIARSVGVPTPNIDALFGLARLFARQRGLYPNGSG